MTAPGVKKKKRRFFGRSKHRRRHKDRRMPIIGTMGAVGSFFVPRDASHASPAQWVVDTFTHGRLDMTKNPDAPRQMLADTLATYIGYDFRDGSWGIPMGSVVLVGSQVASKLVTKFAGNPLAKIPYVGKYVKF